MQIPQNNDFDLEKMTFKCHCCDMDRQDKYIKVYRHDIGALRGNDPGVMFVNVRYCIDVEICKNKASDRNWVINKFFPGNKDDKKLPVT